MADDRENDPDPTADRRSAGEHSTDEHRSGSADDHSADATQVVSRGATPAPRPGTDTSGTDTSGTAASGAAASPSSASSSAGPDLTKRADADPTTGGQQAFHGSGYQQPDSSPTAYSQAANPQPSGQSAYSQSPYSQSPYTGSPSGPNYAAPTYQGYQQPDSGYQSGPSYQQSSSGYQQSPSGYQPAYQGSAGYGPYQQQSPVPQQIIVQSAPLNRRGIIGGMLLLMATVAATISLFVPAASEGDVTLFDVLGGGRTHGFVAGWMFAFVCCIIGVAVLCFIGSLISLSFDGAAGGAFGLIGALGGIAAVVLLFVIGEDRVFDFAGPGIWLAMISAVIALIGSVVAFTRH